MKGKKMNFAQKVMNAKLGETHLFYLGQAGYIIKSKSGELLAVDMYLSNCMERVEGHMGFKRLLPQILMEDEIEFDYIIATHPHMDHFDIDSIPQMMYGTKTHLFASYDCREYANEFGMDEKRITYIKPGDDCKAGDFNVHFVNCDHGTGAPDAVGVIFEVDEQRIYMAGDTSLRLDRAIEYTRYGEIDILIGPINGAFGNMDEQDFADFSGAISPRLTIPCHYGMFAIHGGDPGKFMNIMRKQNRKFLLMAVGEQLTL